MKESTRKHLVVISCLLLGLLVGTVGTINYYEDKMREKEESCSTVLKNNSKTIDKLSEYVKDCKR